MYDCNNTDNFEGGFEIVGPYNADELDPATMGMFSRIKTFEYNPLLEPRVMLFLDEGFSLKNGGGSLMEG